MTRGRLGVVRLFFLAAIGLPATGRGQPPAPPAPDSAEQLQALLTAIVREHLPCAVEERDDWGKTTEVWDGLRITGDGLRIKTNSRKKAVNHGTWKLYQIRLVNPDEQFRIGVENVRSGADGRAELDVWAEAALTVTARLNQWEYGVLLLGVSAEADTRVRLRVHCNLGLKLDPTKLPPDVLLDPKVTDATVELVDFRLRRISDLHGPVVHELGKSARAVIERKLADQRPKLVDKLNRQIAKRQKALRLSLHDVIASKWGAMAAEYLPAAPKPEK